MEISELWHKIRNRIYEPVYLAKCFYRANFKNMFYERRMKNGRKEKFGRWQAARRAS
jgi:hypothetical protein